MESGVYSIVLQGVVVYIGSSMYLRKRWNVHLSSLRRNRHINKHLQHSFNRNGEQAFQFVIMEYCDIDTLVDREQAWLDKLWDSTPRLFNVFRQAYAVRGMNHPMFGKTHSEEAKRKIRVRRSTQTITHSKFTREKIGTSNTGKRKSAETCHKISVAKRGGSAWNKGLTVTDPRVAKHCPARSTVVSEQADIVIRRYGIGESVESLRRWLCCSWDVVERFLRESGVAIRSISEQKRIRDAAGKPREDM